jgi:release factor glutamine methyltransferase
LSRSELPFKTPLLRDALTAGTSLAMIGEVADLFKRYGISGSERTEAEQLVGLATGRSRFDVYLHPNQPISSDQRRTLQGMVERRLQHEPLAYILGSVAFWTLELKVGPGVLIPRPESEFLVEMSLALIDTMGRKRRLEILELGTGSGAIILSLAVERRGMRILGIDKSLAAIAYARQNIQCYQPAITANDNRIDLICADGFSSLQKKPVFDLLISNPPYIPSAEITGLQNEVCEWEPRIALDGGLDGLDWYRRIESAAATLLRPDGMLVLEHGWNQRLGIQSLIERAGRFALFRATTDYGGKDRVMAFRRK